jgi:hypothetical protein
VLIRDIIIAQSKRPANADSRILAVDKEFFSGCASPGH